MKLVHLNYGQIQNLEPRGIQPCFYCHKQYLMSENQALVYLDIQFRKYRSVQVQSVYDLHKIMTLVVHRENRTCITYLTCYSQVVQYIPLNFIIEKLIAIYSLVVYCFYHYITFILLCAPKVNHHFLYATFYGLTSIPQLFADPSMHFAMPSRSLSL